VAHFPHLTPLTDIFSNDIVNLMGLIVVSKVLKYKAFIFALALVISLSFFQSSQSLNESTQTPSSRENNSDLSASSETPSIPEIPNLPDEDSDVDENENVSKASISIRVKTTTNSLTNIEGDLELDETTIEIIEREITSGSIKLSFTSNGGDFKIKEKIEDEEGKTSVKFSSKSNQKTINEISSETSVDLEN